VCVSDGAEGSEGDEPSRDDGGHFPRQQLHHGGCTGHHAGSRWGCTVLHVGVGGKIRPIKCTESLGSILVNKTNVTVQPTGFAY